MRTLRSLWRALPLLAVAGMLAAFAPPPASPTALTESEADGLAFMREEEKLAHDLYVELADKYGLPVFSNIARSESMHMDAVLTLLEAHGLPDPAAGKQPGEFTDPTLQALYDDLLARAEESTVEALRAAALVEETDILDLQARLARTNAPDIAQAYQNLLQASGMHLRAFAMQVERQTGSEYEPELLDASTYASLADGAQAGGFGAGMRGRRGGGPW
jgi:hypothetical protein